MPDWLASLGPIVARHPHLQDDAAAVGLGERGKDAARGIAVQHLMPMLAHDPDDREIVRRTIAWWQRVTQMLP